MFLKLGNPLVSLTRLINVQKHLKTVNDRAMGGKMPLHRIIYSILNILLEKWHRLLYTPWRFRSFANNKVILPVNTLLVVPIGYSKGIYSKESLLV